MRRVFYQCDSLDLAPEDRAQVAPDEYEDRPADRRPVPPEQANLVSSEVAHSDGEQHLPVLDLDGVEVEHAIDVCLFLRPDLTGRDFVSIPSSTPGHHHLYIERPMSWGQYKAMLCALSEMAVLEPGWVNASLARKASFVRVPGLRRATPRHDG